MLLPQIDPLSSGERISLEAALNPLGYMYNLEEVLIYLITQFYCGDLIKHGLGRAILCFG